MPGGLLDARCQRTLEDIACISQRIRLYVRRDENSRNILAVNRFRAEIEEVRRSAEALHEAFTLQNRNLDENLFTWISRGGLWQCFDKLKDMERILDLDNLNQVQLQVGLAEHNVTRATFGLNNQVQLQAGLAEDSVTAVIAFFNHHKDTFQFLLDENLLDHAAQPHQLLPIPDSFRSAGEMQNDMEESTMASIAVVAHNQFILQKLDEVTRWLAALDCTERHIETLKLRQLGTCTWFPKTAAYKVWRSGKSTFLWIYGKAGCGKSVTAASILEHLKGTLAPGEPLVYFYCDFRIKRSTSATEVMRALLSQLFRHLHNFRVDPGALPNWILEQKRESGALLLDDLDRLASWVCRAASRFSHKPIIVIDALDECANTRELLGALMMLIQADVRLLVTSRPEESIKQHLGRYPSLSFQEMGKELASDIDMHITRELSLYTELRFADACVKNEIRAKLCEKAEGRFRWIQCQLDRLRLCSSRRELQQVLADLPGELETTYERILDKIDERRSEGNVLRRALAWLMVALEPLCLVQLIEGLTLDAQPRRTDCETRSMGSALVHALSSLVNYNDATDVLAISHHTVKEYLTSRTALPVYQIVLHEAHIEVVQMCTFFIALLLKKVHFRAKKMLLESFPILTYVFAVGFDHLAHVDPGSTNILDVLQSFASEVHRHPSLWDILCELREEGSRRLYPPWPSSRHDLVPYLLIAYSSPNLFRSFLQSRPLEARAGTNPLVYAVDFYKTTHALALLQGGVNVNEAGLVVDDSRHALPLEVAVDLGNEVIVGELLRKGSIVPSELFMTAVCMPWCTARVLVHLVHTDAFKEWAHDMKDKELYRSIFSSARPNAGDASQVDRDHVALARRLREVGQNLSANSAFGVELIERALHAGHASMLDHLLPPDQPPQDRFLITACTGNTPETVAVVRVLLQRGVNVHAVSPEQNRTALHLAAMCPWEPLALELTKVLLDAGCKPSARDRRRETPMTIALGRGYLTVVEHLSRSGPIPSYILLYAVQRRMRPPVIQLLIDQGADVHVRTSSGNTVIHLVLMKQRDSDTETWYDEDQAIERVESGQLEDLGAAAAEGEEEYYEGQRLHLVKMFIESGCDPTSNGDAKRTQVIDIAIHHAYNSVVEYLLSCGVPVPSDILHTAVERGLTPRVVELFLGKGADVHCKTGTGDTVLHLAITMSHELRCLDLLKIFISAGCDPTSSGSNGRSVLDLAISREYTFVVEYLLSLGVLLPPDVLATGMQIGMSCKMAQFLLCKGANVRSRTSAGDTLLHLAITRYPESQCLDLVKALIQAGCDPMSRDNHKMKVLELAIKRGYSSVVEYLLLSCGVSVPPDILPTALQRCLIPKVVELLLYKGADVHIEISIPVPMGGGTVLHLAVARFPEPQCLRLIKIFIRAGCDPASSGDNGRKILELAINRGYKSVVGYLLSRGVLLPPDVLSTGMKNGLSCKMVRFLLHKGANACSRTSGADTLLHLAVTRFPESRCLNLVKVFIEAGCDPASSGADGKTVLELAVNHAYNSVVEYLLSCGVAVASGILPVALQIGLTCQVVELLLRKGADVHSKTSKGDTVLHLAATRTPESQCLHLVKIFVEAGCDPTSRGANGSSALELFIACEYLSVVEHLLSHGVMLPPDVLLTGIQSHVSCETIQFLLRKGANVQSRTDARDTVLHLAITTFHELRCLDLARIFIEAGCDPSTIGAKGRSVLELAINYGYSSVVDYLLSRGVILPPDVLLTGMQSGLGCKMAEFLLRKGVDSRTDEGDTVLHLAITRFPESRCLYLVKIFVKAGCDPTSSGAKGRSVLEVAVNQGYNSVVEALLSYNVPLPPDILLIALSLRSTPKMVEVLVHNGADVHFTTSDGVTLHEIASASYVEPELQWIMALLASGAAHHTKRVYDDANHSMEESGSSHVAKRPRLT